MEKQEFIAIIKEFRAKITNVSKACQKATGNQIQTRQLLRDLELIATIWFDEIESSLRSNFDYNENILEKYNDLFGKILEICHGRPSKSATIALLDSIIGQFHLEILVPIQKERSVLNKFKKLDNLLTHATDLEKEYLTEAIECARLGKNRASIIMGWCATANRLHKYIESIGFDKLNNASKRMQAMTTGRYKRFSNKYDIQNLTDLRMTVFDRNLLWVMEFLGAIDGNQHERLGICLTMRDTSAHPGEAVISDENILSFFSDIENLVFANSKFAI